MSQTQLTSEFVSVLRVGRLMPGVYYSLYKALQSKAVKILASQTVSEPP